MRAGLFLPRWDPSPRLFALDFLLPFKSLSGCTAAVWGSAYSSFFPSLHKCQSSRSVALRSYSGFFSLLTEVALVILSWLLLPRGPSLTHPAYPSDPEGGSNFHKGAQLQHFAPPRPASICGVDSPRYTGDQGSRQRNVPDVTDSAQGQPWLSSLIFPSMQPPGLYQHYVQQSLERWLSQVKVTWLLGRRREGGGEDESQRASVCPLQRAFLESLTPWGSGARAVGGCVEMGTARPTAWAAGPTATWSVGT